MRSINPGTQQPKEDIAEVSLLGYEGKIQWAQTQGGLFAEMPADITNAHAYVFKMKVK